MCKKNVANIRALAEHTRNHYRLVGLSLSSQGLAEYIAQHGIDFPVLTDPDPETVRSYHLGPTPATILITAGGTVQKVWLGAWTERTQTEIETRFGLLLPGLQGRIRNSPANIQPKND